MTPHKSPLGSIIQINLQFLTVLILTLMALWIWPDDPFWWPMGIVSIVSVLAALSLFVQALRAIGTLHRREKTMKEFLARGKSPKSAKLANNETLERAGML